MSKHDRKTARHALQSQVQTAIDGIETGTKFLKELHDKYAARAILLAQKAKVTPVFRDRSPMRPDFIEVVPEGVKLTWKNPLGNDETFTAIWKTLDNELH